MNEDQRKPEDSSAEAHAPPALTEDVSPLSPVRQGDAEAVADSASTEETGESPIREVEVTAAPPSDTTLEEDGLSPRSEEALDSTVQSSADSQAETVAAPESSVAASDTDRSAPSDSGPGSNTADSSRSKEPSTSTEPAKSTRSETPPASLSTAETTDRIDPRLRKPALYKPRMDPGQTRFRPRQPMSDISLADIHYKNVDVLIRFIDGQGRILPRRKTRIGAKMQRRVKTAIKQARHLALLPYTPGHIRSVRRR